MWQITDLLLWSEEYPEGFPDLEYCLLSVGWEPYSVTELDDSATLFLRRYVEGGYPEFKTEEEKRDYSTNKH